MGARGAITGARRGFCRGSRRRAAAIATVAALATGCDRPDPGAARHRAIAWFGTHESEPDPGGSSIFELLQRRFGLVVRLADGRAAPILRP